MSNKRNVLLMLPLLAITLAGFNLPVGASTTRNFVIYQNNNSFGKCSGQLNCFNSTSPGPDFNVNQGDQVSITVRNNDTITHTFTLNASQTPASPYNIDISLNAHQNVTIPPFTASTSGTFKYECKIHPNDMFGNFVVKATTTKTPITPLIALSLLLTTASAGYVMKRRRL